MALALLSLLLAAAAVAQNDENCLPGTWLPEGADWSFCAVPGLEYDGSKVPDCSAFHGLVNTTSFFHVHEYDCGLYWECSPEGPCLMQCPACNTHPGNCPDGRLQFDCRYTVPVGPVCDFYSAVGCHNCEETCAANNCPGTDCDTSTDCQCSDCKTDTDCSSGEKCCDRQCAFSCDGDTTTATTTTSKPTPTEPLCPTECCSDNQCEEDFLCENGKCKKPCHCEEGWEVFGDQCYYFSTDKKNWTDAEEFCQEQFGHLASANTKAIQDYVVDEMKNRSLDYAWFGGNDRKEEGVWTWTDYTPWEFTSWGPGEPNNLGGNEGCLEYSIWKGQECTERTCPNVWNDYPCTENQPFVCKKYICNK